MTRRGGDNITGSTKHTRRRQTSCGLTFVERVAIEGPRENAQCSSCVVRWQLMGKIRTGNQRLLQSGSTHLDPHNCDSVGETIC